MDALREIFCLWCHQIPDRSPQLDGVVFPLCFRCAGVYLGLFGGYVWILLSRGFPCRFPRLGLVLAACLSMTPYFIDGWGNALGLWDSPAWVRAFTGIGIGLMLPMLLVPLASRERAALRPGVRDFKALAGPALFVSGAAVALLDPHSLWIFRGVGALCILGFTLFMANFALAAFLSLHPRQAALRRAAPPGPNTRVERWI